MSVANLIISEQSKPTKVFSCPVGVCESMGVLMAGIAIVKVQKWSLGQGQHQASDHTKMERSTHVVILYLDIKVSEPAAGDRLPED